MAIETTEATETPTDGRDYVANPSLDFPASAEEARLAVIDAVYRSCTDPTVPGPLRAPFTVEAGFGMKRTAEQARWLEDARQAVLAGVGHVLSVMRDDIDEDEIRQARA